MMANKVTGRCLCGAVRFAFDEGPIATRACWCRVCQYLSTGNASVNAIFKTDTLELEGELGEYVSRADSGNEMRRRFCRTCGTPLFSESSGRAGFMVVRVGALDDRETGGPSSYIWTASAPSWGLLTECAENCEGQPAPFQAR